MNAEARLHWIRLGRIQTKKPVELKIPLNDVGEVVEGQQYRITDCLNEDPRIMWLCMLDCLFRRGFKRMLASFACVVAHRDREAGRAHKVG